MYGTCRDPITAFEDGWIPYPNQFVPSVTCSCNPPVILTMIGVPQDNDSNVARPNPSASLILMVKSAALYIAAKCFASIFSVERSTCPLSTPKCCIKCGKSWPFGSRGSVCINKVALSWPTLSNHSLNHQIKVPDCFLLAFLLFQKKIFLLGFLKFVLLVIILCLISAIAAISAGLFFLNG